MENNNQEQLVRVRIVNTADDAWYEAGDEFDVKDYGKWFETKTGKLILKSDCEVISSPEKENRESNDNVEYERKYQVEDAFGDMKDCTYETYDNFPTSHPKRIITLLNGVEVHPEDCCQRCGGKNVIWSADNDLFNEVNGSPNGIMCPQCFSEMAKEKGIEIIFRVLK